MSEKLRICEVLGVEVGEKFRISGSISPYFVDESGQLNYEHGNVVASGVTLANIINDPSLIQKIHTLTNREREVLEALRVLGFDEVRKEKTGYGYAHKRLDCENITLYDSDGFDFMKPNETASISYLLGK